MIELLAPSKDLTKAKVAIDFGADAVYIGGKSYSLRSRASNFGLDEIKEIVTYAHSFNKKVYVTVNMVFHDEDLFGIRKYIKDLANIGVDALIVESFALIALIKKVAPDMEVHISTQSSALNSNTVEVYRRWGADRIVLGRECTMEDIEIIAKRSDLPLEVFIHGGMCSNISGRCTLSNHMCLRDANRGGCAHSCRWRYDLYADDKRVSDDKKLFSMASKDLRASAYIERMIKCGVASLKIEGRMKSEYYIAQITKTYRKLIDEIYRDGHISKERIIYYDEELAKAENRISDVGFLAGLKDDKQIYEKEAAMVTHDFVGYVLDQSDGLTKVEVRNRFKRLDDLEVFGPDIDNERFRVDMILDEEGNAIDLANKPMSQVYLKIPFVVKKGDMIRKYQ